MWQREESKGRMGAYEQFTHIHTRTHTRARTHTHINTRLTYVSTLTCTTSPSRGRRFPDPSSFVSTTNPLASSSSNASLSLNACCPPAAIVAPTLPDSDADADAGAAAAAEAEAARGASVRRA